MAKYHIPVFWQMFGWVEVEANSLADAVREVESDETPLPEGTYVDASFEVEHESLAEDYPDEDF